MRPKTHSAERPTTLLGIWAHPDDEAYLSAALMARVASGGGRVVVVSATRGELGGPAPGGDVDRLARRREAELRNALAAVGVEELHVLGLADGGCAAAGHAEQSARLEATMRAVAPDLVVTFGPDGITGHDDHRAVSGWALDAWARARTGRLLLATMTDAFLAANDDLHRLVGLSMGPPLVSVPDAEVALRVRPSPAERRRKAAALRAHASQTVPLVELLGADRFHGWWVEEAFRAPTEADLRWAAARGADLTAVAS
jgi:LmbE family N-acetylglucosaminyl deacetylase